MSVPEALRDSRLRRYPLRHRRVGVRGGQLSLVTPRSLDAVLGQPGRSTRIAEGQEGMPYWAQLWATSIGIARVLMAGPDLAGRRVLDLGCGLGLAGTAAGCRGAEVLFVDFDRDALRFAAFNARRNGVVRSDGLQADFRNRAVPGRFDLILLADVAYEEDLHEPLANLIQPHLLAGGRALHADPFRDLAGAFLARARAEHPVAETSMEVCFEGRTEQIRLAWIGGDA